MGALLGCSVACGCCVGEKEGNSVVAEGDCVCGAVVGDAVVRDGDAVVGAVGAAVAVVVVWVGDRDGGSVAIIVTRAVAFVWLGALAVAFVWLEPFKSDDGEFC